MTVHFDDMAVTWLGYATAKVVGPGGTVVYTDPGRYGVLDGYEAGDGDVVLVTHDHHYDSDGIRRVAADDATVVVHEAVDADSIDRDVDRVEDLPYEVVRIDVGSQLTLADGAVEIWATPAYNEADGPHARADGTVSHPPGDGCGYRFSVDGRTVFWPGDSDVLDAFSTIETSVFLANIGGSIVMDRHEAADLAEILMPDLVVPIHYDTIEVLEADAEAFAVDVASRSIPVALDVP